MVILLERLSDVFKDLIVQTIFHLSIAIIS